MSVLILIYAISNPQSLSTKGAYDESDLERFGYMWCGLSSGQASKLSETAVDQYMGRLKNCFHFESNTRAALVKRAVSISG